MNTVNFEKILNETNARIQRAGVYAALMSAIIPANKIIRKGGDRSLLPNALKAFELMKALFAEQLGYTIEANFYKNRGFTSLTINGKKSRFFS